MHDFPGGETRVRRRIPIGGQFLRLQQPHLAAPESRMPAFGETADGRVLGLAERLGDAVFTFGEAELLEPGQRPTAVGVEIAFLFGQASSSVCIDQCQRLAHRNGLAFGVEHLGVARVDGHARTDGGLREIDRRDVACLEMAQRDGQFGLQCGNELTASSSRARLRHVSGRRGRCWRRAHSATPSKPADCSVRIGQVPLIAKASAELLHQGTFPIRCWRHPRRSRSLLV